MSLNTIFQFFVPKDKKFFPLFESAAANVVKMSHLLNEAINTNDSEKRHEIIREIDHLEHVGDHASHQVFIELGKNFITPFDREDIHALAAAIDDVADYIHGTANRIMMYKIEKFPETIHKLSELTIEACVELEKAVKELRNMKNIRTLTDAFIRINSIENQADYIFDTAIGDLFDSETNALEVIKQKEILSALETATDKAEDAANVIESIIIKYV
jgi:predicted phosphate transport protein (TIGR00153 family)